MSNPVTNKRAVTRNRTLTAAMIVSGRVDPGRDAEMASLLAVLALVAAEQAAAAAAA